MFYTPPQERGRSSSAPLVLGLVLLLLFLTLQTDWSSPSGGSHQHAGNVRLDQSIERLRAEVRDKVRWLR